MPQLTAKLVEILSARVNPASPRGVEGFSSLHPIMRVREWIDRRISARTRIDKPATVTFNGKELQAVVLDMSATGAGISGVPELRAGDLLVVSIHKLSPMRCQVVWATGDRAGVKFIQAN